jgi:hypothetical protein
MKAFSVILSCLFPVVWFAAQCTLPADLANATALPSLLIVLIGVAFALCLYCVADIRAALRKGQR